MSNFNESFNKKIRIELSEQKGGVALSPAQIKNAVEAAAKAGAGIVKLVGQDPVRYSGLKALVKDIKRTEGIFEVSLTTDGHGLGDAAKGLAAAGLDRVNINVDTLKYSKYTGSGELDDIVTAINAATDAGLKPVKLNILLKKDYSEDEIMDFVQLTLQHQYEIRFIEMTEEEEAESEYEALLCADVKKRLPALRPGLMGDDGKALSDPRDGTADVYKYPGALGKICFIEKRAADFAQRCADLYISAAGVLKRDEKDENGINLKPIADDKEKLAAAIREILG